MTGIVQQLDVGTHFFQSCCSYPRIVISWRNTYILPGEIMGCGDIIFLSANFQVLFWYEQKKKRSWKAELWWMNLSIANRVPIKWKVILSSNSELKMKGPEEFLFVSRLPYFQMFVCIRIRVPSSFDIQWLLLIFVQWCWVQIGL